jgi:glutamate 5-kinase
MLKLTEKTFERPSIAKLKILYQSHNLRAIHQKQQSKIAAVLHFKK